MVRSETPAVNKTGQDKVSLTVAGAHQGDTLGSCQSPVGQVVARYNGQE